MFIKQNDKVKITAGKDKGKTGKVLQIFPEKNRVSVEGLNLLIKHLRPNRKGEKGQRVEFPSAMDISNLILVCPKCNKPAKVGYRATEKGKKFRYCKKCDQTIA